MLGNPGFSHMSLFGTEMQFAQSWEQAALLVKTTGKTHMVIHFAVTENNYGLVSH